MRAPRSGATATRLRPCTDLRAGVRPDPGIADAPDVPGILFGVDVLALVAGAHDGLGGHAAQQLFAVAPDRLALPGRAAVLARALGLLDFLLPETEFPVFSFEHALGVLDQQVRELEEWFIRRVVVRRGLRVIVRLL